MLRNNIPMGFKHHNPEVFRISFLSENPLFYDIKKSQFPFGKFYLPLNNPSKKYQHKFFRLLPEELSQI